MIDSSNMSDSSKSSAAANTQSVTPVTPVNLAMGSRLRPSPYYEATRRWGAKVFSVYNHMLMPSVYESAAADYAHIVNGVTLWDVAAERQTEISGPDAAAFVQYLTPRNLSTCTAGKCRYILMTAEDGGVINDPVLLRLADDRFWLSAADSDILLWCRGLAQSQNLSINIRMAAAFPLQLQGPHAPDVAAALFGDWVRDLKYFHLCEWEWEGVPLVISRTGWSGELGYEIYLCDGERGDWLWERIMTAGKPFNIRPASPSTIRRLEGGLLSYGADADVQDTPYHLGLSRLVNLDGDFDFCGKAALQVAAAQPLTRRLTGVVIDGEPLTASAMRWWKVTDLKGNSAGTVRSAIHSPNYGNIGMAMLNCPLDVAGSEFKVQTEWGDVRTARSHELPFTPPKKPAKK